MLEAIQFILLLLKEVADSFFEEAWTCQLLACGNLSERNDDHRMVTSLLFQKSKRHAIMRWSTYIAPSYTSQYMSPFSLNFHHLLEVLIINFIAYIRVK